jgi:hypothetical protein
LEKKLPKILYHKIETKNPGTSLIMASFFLSCKRRMIDSFSHGNALMFECLWNTDKVIPNIYVREVGHCVNYMDDTWMIYSGDLEEHWIVRCTLHEMCMWWCMECMCYNTWHNFWPTHIVYGTTVAFSCWRYYLVVYLGDISWE